MLILCRRQRWRICCGRKSEKEDKRAENNETTHVDICRKQMIEKLIQLKSQSKDFQLEWRICDLVEK